MGFFISQLLFIYGKHRTDTAPEGVVHAGAGDFAGNPKPRNYTRHSNSPPTIGGCAARDDESRFKPAAEETLMRGGAYVRKQSGGAACRP
jgi:hypothetical protein